MISTPSSWPWTSLYTNPSPPKHPSDCESSPTSLPVLLDRIFCSIAPKQISLTHCTDDWSTPIRFRFLSWRLGFSIVDFGVTTIQDAIAWTIFSSRGLWIRWGLSSFGRVGLTSLLTIRVSWVPVHFAQTTYVSSHLATPAQSLWSTSADAAETPSTSQVWFN